MKKSKKRGVFLPKTKLRLPSVLSFPRRIKQKLMRVEDRYMSVPLYSAPSVRFKKMRSELAKDTLRLITPAKVKSAARAVHVAKLFADRLPNDGFSKALTCARRQERRESIFATGYGGKGGPQRPHDRSASKVKC